MVQSSVVRPESDRGQLLAARRRSLVLSESERSSREDAFGGVGDGGEFTVITGPCLPAKVRGGYLEFVAVVAKLGIHQVTLAQVSRSQRPMPKISGRDGGMPGAPEGAPRDIEEEVSAHRTLPREDCCHASRIIIRNQDILMK